MMDQPREKDPNLGINESIRDDADTFILQFQDLYERERVFFIRDAIQVFKEAINQEAKQQINIDNLPDGIFRHYKLSYFAEERTAQEGTKFKHTIGVRLVERLDKHGRPAGDEMQLRIVIPEDLVLTAYTDPEIIKTWLDSVREVYVCYKSGKRFRRKAAMYRIMPEGFQHYAPIEDESKVDMDQEILSFIAASKEQTHATFKDALTTYDFLTKLGTFIGVPMRYTKL